MMFIANLCNAIKTCPQNPLSYNIYLVVKTHSFFFVAKLYCYCTIVSDDTILIKAKIYT